MKSHLIHLALAVIFTALLFGGQWFWYTTVSAKSAAVAGLQEQIVAKTETMGRIASARAALSEIIGDETTVQSYFVPENGVVGFIDTLETKGKTQGSLVEIASVSKGEDLTKPTLVLSLTISGTFDAVMRTVGAIEYAPYAVTVSQFSILQEEKGGWRADMKISVGSVKTAVTTP